MVLIRSYICMLLVSLYILSVPLQEASELPVVLVLHDHIFPKFVNILQAKFCTAVNLYITKFVILYITKFGMAWWCYRL